MNYKILMPKSEELKSGNDKSRLILAKAFSKNVRLRLWDTVNVEGFGTECLRYSEPFVPALSTSTTCSTLLDETWPLRSRNGTLRKRIFWFPQSSIAPIYARTNEHRVGSEQKKKK